ncbi:D-arabinono-1,4-lactone oxidase [Microbacterium immunditiarum]|uniref:Xylitol oxidase n=1 Tax=Microbacterium immunditiarum TaxID=337480 RepID=A0A7Y9GMJ5_9MICO|nr:xylitol oxidase [Microbacterium immunditiarum]
MTAAGANWAGNLTYSARELVAPATVDELRRVVASAARVKALGSRHSFNRIADTDGVLVSAAALGGPELDSGRAVVRAPAGMRYGELAPWLQERGWALANLASLPHISLAGAVSTGTHGSGDRNPSLAEAVEGVEFVGADGEVHRIARGDADFGSAVVSLGALGVTTAIELRVEPTFEVAQTVYPDAPLDRVLERYDSVTGAAYSVSLFTTWRDPDRVDQIWVKERLDRPGPGLPEGLGVSAAGGPLHPLPGVSAEPCTTQGGVPGPWLARLPHFRLEFTPSNGDELQSEYLVPRTAGVAAIEALRGLAARIAPLLQVCELRTVAADTQWLAPSGGRDSTALHFTWKPLQREVEAFLPELESALAPFEARPHWGKLFDTSGVSRLPGFYPEWERFAELRERLDPRGIFVNGFLEAVGL